MNKLVILGVSLVALTLSLAGAQMTNQQKGGIRRDGYLYRGQDMEVLHSIRMNDRSTYPTMGYDFYKGQTVRPRTPYVANSPMGGGINVDRQRQEALANKDPVAKAMTLTRNLEARICDAKEDLSIVDDAPCKTNDDCDLICRDYAGKQEEVVSAFYCDPRGNTCGCCSPQTSSGSRSDNFGEPSFGSGSSNVAPSSSGSSFGPSSSGSNFGPSSSGSSFGPSSSGSFGSDPFSGSGSGNSGSFGSNSDPFGNSFSNEGNNMGSTMMAQPPNMNQGVPSNMAPPSNFGGGGNQNMGGDGAGNAMLYDPNSYNQPNYYPNNNGDYSGYAAM